MLKNVKGSHRNQATIPGRETVETEQVYQEENEFMANNPTDPGKSRSLLFRETSKSDYVEKTKT